MANQRVAAARKPKPQSVVYFVRALDLVKIGTTSTLEKRMSALSGHSPVQVMLYGTILGDYQLERELHQRFANHRVHHEWFQWDPIHEQVEVLLRKRGAPASTQSAGSANRAGQLYLLSGRGSAIANKPQFDQSVEAVDAVVDDGR